MGRKQSEVIFRPPAPERPRPVTESVLVPLLRALVSGVLVTAVLVFAVQVWGGRWLSWPVVGLVVCCVCVTIWGLSTWKGLLHRFETATSRDWDGDGVIGEDPDRLILVRQRQPEASQASEKRAQFATFVNACEASGDTSSRRWESSLGRATYNRWRSVLIEAGYASWRSPGSPGQGWALTVPASEILEALD